ncbi:MBL fold metallo-hydrolase [Paenibacillus sp.]|uniref:MBL fold metallo-hydrolase n=1 Tax=Paenibacillus sp. TaxID=58172 RepID=UPI002D64C9FF|nr:MBL fold metallo-hydrolase [Paenibacillus sp.]HZG57657.1 MBL fold metallo-hydrolase [Paenibacillus sp.]
MTIRIETLALGPLSTNCYLLVDEEAGRGVVIDPGQRPEALLRRIEPLEIEAIVLTHAHFDHIGGVDAVRKAKGCPVYLHDAEADWLGDPKLNGSLNWPDTGPPVSTEPAEYALDEGMKLQLLGETFRVLHTPGHSPGSVSLLWGGHLFGGDVLFKTGVGRTDLRGGSSKELYNSIHDKLFRLPDETVVYPGHGPRTTIGYEKAHNPYV